MDKRYPERQCVGCGKKRPKTELIRIVRKGDGGIALDITGREHGRGAYICKSADCLDKAKKRKSLNRAFKLNVEDRVYETLKEELTRVYGG